MQHDQSRFTITLTATFTAGPLREPLGFWMHTLGLPAGIQVSPLNQVFQQLLDPASPVRRNTGANVVLVRLDDWCRIEEGFEQETGGGTRVRDKIARNVDELVDAVRKAATASAAPYIVCFCPQSPVFTVDPAHDFGDIVQGAVAALSAVDGVQVLTAADIAQQYPVEDIHDFHADRLGHIPYKQPWFDALATMLMRRIRALREAPRKLVVLDCDNTLWRGVLAEDDALAVDAAHAYLQEFMLRQHADGTLLALSSKNEEADVWRVFDTLPGMRLTRQHIVAHRIGWTDKASGVRALASELGLGLDAVVFVDDNPVECAAVSAGCPGVVTLCLPAQADAIPAFLDNAWVFDRGPVTQEDARRNDMYREAAQRTQYQQQSESFETFLRGLDMVVDIRPLEAATLTRAAQLGQRVNQFNLTGLRLDEAALQALAGEPRGQVLTVAVRDRFGDYGLVGLMLCRADGQTLDVLNLLLSCRALGKGVEHRMLAELGRRASAAGLSGVHLSLQPSERNQPARDFLHQVAAQVERIDGGTHHYDLTAASAAAVDFLNFIQQAAQPRTAAATEVAASPVATPTADVSSDADLHQRIATELDSARRIHAAVLAHWQTRLTGGAAPRARVAPRTDTEAAIATIWRELLDLEDLGVTDDFFSLGGESIKAVQILARIREHFGVELPMTVLFADSITVARLAEKVDTTLLEQVDASALAAELAAIENLSEEEIERLLGQAS
ncbi:MAG: HAD-IIIC family phosphatase [Moraxellaceae bacterium]|nr:HAD-IIIC family phosphatase [Moraxellaceae bacterium]